MKSKEGPIEVQLYECHGDHNQHYLIVDGKMKSYAIQERCLTAEAVENNANVEMKLCEDGNPTQQWELTGDGYVKSAGSTRCGCGPPSRMARWSRRRQSRSGPWGPCQAPGEAAPWPWQLPERWGSSQQARLWACVPAGRHFRRL